MELLAVVLALQRWKHYLLGRHFLLKTDHYTLKYLLEQRTTTTEQQRLLVKLMPYDLLLCIVQGKKTRSWFPLSMPTTSWFFYLSNATTSLDLMQLQKFLIEDPHTKAIMESLPSYPKIVPYFSISGHKLYFKDKWVIPADEKLRREILSKSHDTLVGGHVGYLKTLKHISQSFYWPNLK